MEKIKQALEQARQQRQSGSQVSSANAVPPAEIVYTKTQSVESSPSIMRENRLISSMESSEYTDAIKMLSTQVLQRMEENRWGSVAVTSPRADMGATTIALNLGLSIAREMSTPC